MERPTLSLQTVYLHDSDRSEARRLGRDLFGLLTRPLDRPLSHGPGIPVLCGVSAGHVDLHAAEVVVLVALLGKTAFQVARAETLTQLTAWHTQLGTGHVLIVPTAPVWRTVESSLPSKQLLTELYGETDRRRATIDEIVLAVTRLLEPDRSKVQIFVSHSKADLDSTGQAASAIVRHVKTDTTGRAFFDAVDLEPGASLAEQIDAAAGRGVLVSVRSDAYGSRAWCQRELLAAKRQGLPTLTVEILKSGEGRSSPYGGNAPCVVWQDNAAEVARRAMVEWLRAAHFEREGQRVCGAAALPSTTVILARPPELLDLAQGRLREAQGGLVLYPDPELSVQERQILAAAAPRLRLMTPTTSFGRALGRDAGSGVAAPLEGRQVALSLSDTFEADNLNLDGPEGYVAQHVEGVTAYIARSLISAGAAIAYGGDFRERGFTTLLGELIAAYNETAARPAEFLHSYLAAPIKLVDAPDALAFVAHHLVDSGDMRREAIVPPPSDREQHPAALYFSDMRRVMAERTFARIVLGGQAVPRIEPNGPGYRGRYPGVVEEAWRTLEAGKPLYVVGGFGGASGLVAELLERPDRIPERLQDVTWMASEAFRTQAGAIDANPYRERLGLPRRMEDLAEVVGALGARHLKSDEASHAWNGLTLGENRRLFRSRDPVVIASLILRGLLAVTRARGQGTLDVELVHGSVTSADQLDAIAVATFDDVPLGGAGAAIDRAIGGLASRCHAERRALVNLNVAEIDADWLYLASLGPLDRIADPATCVERAATATSDQCLRHGFRRLGVVAFGGTVVGNLEDVVNPMLRGFADLAGRTALSWFETNERRFDELRGILESRQDVNLTTKRMAVEAARVVVEEALRIHVSLKDQRLDVSVSPPAGTGIALCRTPELPDANLAALSEGRGPARRSTPALDVLARRGVELATLLLGDEAEEIIARAGDAKIVIVHDVPSSRLPFEMLTTPLSRRCPGATSGISRRLAVGGARVESLFGRPPRAGKLEVLLVANPTGDLPGTLEEAKAVTTILEQQRALVKLTTLIGPDGDRAATKDAVVGALRHADVLHYCGHAFFDGPGPEESGLMLAGKEELTLADLRGLESLPRVAFVNACEAGRVRGEVTTEAAAFAELFLRWGVEAYLGTYWQVDDRAAAGFSTSVYRTLAEGGTLEAAVTKARALLLSSGNEDWANYILYGDGRFQLVREEGGR